ncbi:MAG TPA: DUF72 domain-containing protein [Candidatus Methylacidiphilales bacterium]|nr:DUF72 domain-containing protein [Candidatus Methylacidiphilales bacterium]
MNDLLIPPFPREELKGAVAALAREGIFIGTSSWKYEDWLGMLYTPERYMTRGRVSRAKFEKTCLAEYAEVFKTVCLDGGFYQFPTARMLEGIFTQVPEDFRLALKVTEDITVRRFPSLPRYGKRAGQMNPHFLDADLFVASFLGPLEPYRGRTGALIFEFSPFREGDWARLGQFVEALDVFLARLPKGWDYAVEVRNPALLRAEYFEVLRRHGVAHTFNSWSRMPPVDEQMAMAGSFTAGFAAARFLLKPGRTFEEAVDKFKPYREVKEVNEPVRAAMTDLLTAKAGRPRKRYLYVNNRLEGCSIWTIYAVISGLIKRLAEA